MNRILEVFPELATTPECSIIFLGAGRSFHRISLDHACSGKEISSSATDSDPSRVNESRTP